MTDGRSASALPDWALDWAEIWQSEWRAMAADRELAEAAAACATRWSEGLEAAAALATLFTPARDGPAGRPWPGPAAGTAPAVAASDAVAAAAAQQRVAEARISELAGRVAELERRLAGLAPPGDPPGNP